jgi:hypothetical protein
MAKLFPAEVDKVYLQPDLSIIAPGPLLAPIDDRLRGFAEAESLGLASSYRVTASSLTRALTGGETVPRIREFLSSISLTGIPQPLEYLLNDTAARFGTLRVGERDDGGAYVRSDDAPLLDRLVVDPNLAPLALQRLQPQRVETRFDVTTLYWALADARYPVVAENAAGDVVALRRERRAGGTVAVGDDTAAILVQRVRTFAAPEEDATAWLARQLELAIRNKLTVTVTVQLPDGRTAEYELEPAALAGGRLRARDRRADIERTLPLSSITGVEPPAVE